MNHRSFDYKLRGDSFGFRKKRAALIVQMKPDFVLKEVGCKTRSYTKVT